MLTHTIAINLAYTFFWFVAGAYLVSLGSTASYRVARLGRLSSLARSRSRSEPDQASATVVEGLTRPVNRLMMAMLEKDFCDTCEQPLRLRATLPLIGLFWGCLRCQSRRTVSDDAKYFYSELAGGSAMALLWISAAVDMHDMFWGVLTLFLVSFMVSVKNRLYGDEQQEDPIGNLRAKIALRYTLLSVSAALVPIGWNMPIETNFQVLGTIMLGGIGLLVGVRFDSLATPGATESTQHQLSLRCFSIGLVLGGWFGFALGAVVGVMVLMLVGYPFRKVRRSHWQCLEEKIPVAIALLFLAIAVLAYWGCWPTIWNAVGLQQAEVESIRLFTQWAVEGGYHLVREHVRAYL